MLSNSPRDSIFSVLNADVSSERSMWMELWKASPYREVFAHPDYVRLFATGLGTPQAAYYHGEAGSVLYPFIERSILGGEGGEADLISPYGYGGAFAWNARNRDALLRDFVTRLDAWAASRRIVSEFVRLSLFADDVLEHPEDARERSANVIRSLALDEEELWRDYEAKVRKNVKKALRNDVRIEIDEQGESLEAFYRVFSSTMDRRDASSTYRYSLEFFQELTSALRGNIAYLNAIHKDSVVSTELILVSARSVYSFLGGTLSTAFDARPNDLLKHELILWAKDRGKDYYVLGGGYQPNDGILRYKKSFAPNGIVPFRTGERILDHHVYEALVEKRVQERSESGNNQPLDPSFFPLYRSN